MSEGSPSSSKLIELALTKQRAGVLNEAEEICYKVLDEEPGNTRGLHLLGILCYQKGDYQAALSLINRALSFESLVPEFHVSRGTILATLGDLETARTSWLQALELKPDSEPALLGIAKVLVHQGNHEQALLYYEKARQLDLDNPDIHVEMGLLLRRMGLLNEAIVAFEKAILLGKNDSVAFYQLGEIYFRLSRFVDAEFNFRQAMSRNPTGAETYANLARTLHYQDRINEALQCYRIAITLNPEYSRIHSNFGSLLGELGDINEAENSFEKALKLEPDNEDIRYYYSLTLLKNGKFDPGWAFHESRASARILRAEMTTLCGSSCREWRGESLNFRSILVRAEQGFGDTLQFFRYIKNLIDLGANVTLECQRELVRLLTINTTAHVVEKGGAPEPSGYYTLLLSLPDVFKTGLTSIPGKVSYIVPDRAWVQKYESRFVNKDKLRVGIVWAGRNRPWDASLSRIDKHRSISYSVFDSSLNIAGISLYSLQKGEPVLQAQDAVKEGRLMDWTDEIEDFADTAGFIAHLDLVISVDTAVAHLAAAMGKPTWILSRFDGCWRWLDNRDDSPWYPTVRLFRQVQRGNWDEVLERVTHALSEWVDTTTRRSIPDQQNGV